MRAAFWIAVLAVAAAFFGWETWTAWNAPDTPAPPPAARPSLPPRPAAADNASRAAELAGQIAVIVTKPLFRPDRQPFFETAAGEAPRNYDAELSRFTLVGVLLQGEQRKGLVLGTSAGRPERWEVGAGDLLPGFAVREVQADGLLVTADGKEFLLPLYAGAPKGQAAGSVRTEMPAPTSPGGIPAALQRPGAAPQPAGIFPPPRPSGIPTAPQPPGIPASPYSGRYPSRPPRTYPTQR